MAKKLKGLKKLNKAILAEVACFGIIEVDMQDWAYYHDDDSLTYTLLENRIEDIWFMQFAEKRFGYKPKNNFILSLFHELGHKNTLDEILESDFLEDFCQEEKKRIEMKMQTAGAKKSKKLEWQYFNLPDEIIATAWAIDYMKNHEDEICAMWNRIEKAIQDFYKKNLTEK